MALLKQSSPWVVFYRKLNAMFYTDPEIKVIFDEENNIVSLCVDNPKKANALQILLPEEKTFGNVTLRIEVIPANDAVTNTLVKDDYSHIFSIAFAHNDAFCYSRVIYGVMSNTNTYIVFKNCVVQYFCDALSDVHGLCSTLYQDIANDIFDTLPGVFYCTNVPTDILERGIIL